MSAEPVSGATPWVTDIRLGRWQDVLADVECDALISDPPYGARTHAAGVELPGDRRPLDYASLAPADVHEIGDHWAPRTRGWLCVMTSHDLLPAWEAALARHNRYTFAPLPILGRYRVRLTGDGPGSCVVWMLVSRPKSKAFAGWGSLPAVYDEPPESATGRRIGGKSLGVMRAIVRDYSRPGDLICDPFAGNGTTLRAAIEEGRKAIGAEVDPAAHKIAADWLGQGVTGRLFGEVAL